MTSRCASLRKETMGWSRISDSGKHLWRRAPLKKKTTPTLYRVKTGYGAIWRRHADQMISTDVTSQPSSRSVEPRSSEISPTYSAPAPVPPRARPTNASPATETSAPQPFTPQPAAAQATPKQQPKKHSTRPHRARKIPGKFQDFIMK